MMEKSKPHSRVCSKEGGGGRGGAEGEGVDRQTGHTRVIQGPKGIQGLQCPEQCSCRGPVHEMKGKEVIKAQGLQLQCHCGQVDTLNFWQGCGCQLIEAGFSEQPEGFPWCLTACTV